MIKSKFIVLILPLFALILSCQGTDTYSDLPRPIAQFVSQYWPNPDVSSFSVLNDSTFEVRIKNGPTIKFNDEYDWILINGNGLTLPVILLYDCLPNKLYDYLLSGSMLDKCFVLERTSRSYDLTMLNDNITYDVRTNDIRQF